MIEVLPDMPDGVTGIRASGRISKEDFRAFAPTMEALGAGTEIRIVEVIPDDYEGFGPGGLAEDLKMGFGTLLHHHAVFKRVAVVSDKDWVRHTVHALGWMVPGELAVFGLDELDAAKTWAAS